MFGKHMEVTMSAIKEKQTQKQLNDERTRKIDKARRLLEYARQIERDYLENGVDCIDKYVDEDWLDKLVA
jgi:hypothetical protein